MVRRQKNVDWSPYLEPEDQEHLIGQVDPEGWYPMETFERLGVGIVREVAHGQLMAVRMWGRFQLDGVLQMLPTLISTDDPRGTMMRFTTLRRAFFDYDALEVPEVLDNEATVSIQYAMGAEAEEAACQQTMGFLERLVELAGGREVKARFTAESWRGAPRTIVDLRWS